MSYNEDVGESPIRKTTRSETTWKPGESANPEGRVKGSKNAKPRSKMRSTLAKLYSLEKEACEIIRLSLQPPIKEKDENGKDIGTKPQVDKVQLDTAKFVVKAIESFNNTCLKEEMAILGIKMKDEASGNELEENQEDKVEAPQGFSMDMAENTLKH